MIPGDANDPGPTQWRVADHVRAVAVENLVVILDLRDGEYLLLDRSDAALWTKLIDGSASADERACSGRIDAEQDFLEACRQSGLIVPAATVVVDSEALPSAPARPANAFQAWRCLLSAHRRIRRMEFAGLYAQCRTIAATRHHGWISDLQHAVRCFRRAENFAPSRKGQKDCLPRSLALFGYLRSAGFRVEHVIGVRAYPFAAHAWVELNGRPVLDQDAYLEQFTVIARLGDADAG